ncbi:phosphodiesterase/alkaline phosphatase D-like protein, partial [Bradyrhizobium sp. CIR48]|uniref:alkaline phosphatase D family protein n=1 Tax=Bradyrhizobium sp. CIR48 TaxID=2663840 RepID=UPI0016062C9C
MIPRRRFLVGTLASAAFAAPAGFVRGAPVALGGDPFTLGVASGCPREDRVILWTRLATQPLEGGGMRDVSVEVEWQVAEDEAFGRVVSRGVVRTTAELAHSVHAEATGLLPDRIYWYRFRAGPALSPIGRTRTAPAGSARTFRFAFASCQQYEQGYFTAYRDMAARDLDLVVHLGDYIYEKSWGSRHVRQHGVGIPTTLEEFRNRYAL